MNEARLLPTPAPVRSSKRVEASLVVDVDECPRCDGTGRVRGRRP